MTSEVNWRDVYQAFKRRRDELQSELAEVEASMRAAQRMLASVSRKSEDLPAAPGGPYADLSVIDGAVEILKAHGRPMSHQEISEALIAGGKEHEPGSVYTILRREAQREGARIVQREGDKRFALPEPIRLPSLTPGSPTEHEQPRGLYVTSRQP